MTPGALKALENIDKQAPVALGAVSIALTVALWLSASGVASDLKSGNATLSAQVESLQRQVSQLPSREAIVAILQRQDGLERRIERCEAQMFRSPG